MKEKLQEVIEDVKQTFGLGAYQLHQQQIFREIAGADRTSYILNLEFIPGGEAAADGHHPEGTASIDIDLHTRELKRITFSEEVNLATHEGFPASDKEAAIEWVEEMTGLEFGRQFRLLKDEELALEFEAAVDNIPVHPGGFIHIKFNNDGQLVHFSIYGVFPDESQINWEPFNLTPEKVELVADKQCKLLEIPIEEEGRWLQVYGMEEIFLSNDGATTLPMEQGTVWHSHVPVDKVLEWEKPVKSAFQTEDIDLANEVTAKEALAEVPDPALLPITAEDQTRAIEGAIHFLQQEFPDDSGKWKAAGMQRVSRYIIVVVTPAVPGHRVIERRLKLFLDQETFAVVNYMDDQALLNMLSDYRQAEPAKISRETAFEKLSNSLSARPMYVYEKQQQCYVLCGKLNCGYVVDAVTGELLPVDK
ncbi:hypothetical protein [Lentibacillus sediminis]|uniref:hypothetical protein n=1 Tax=Lentibacillus sediminis TaxID=1940529 RepID=UPI000C1BBA94|nr:hypothetical protein [Lentibacillus sediminis]